MLFCIGCAKYQAQGLNLQGWGCSLDLLVVVSATA